MDSSSEYVYVVNRLLEECQINKRVNTLADCSPSAFVVLFQSLFKTHLPGIVRHPSGKSDHLHNASVVITQLEETLETSLPHITPEGLCDRDEGTICSLVEIFAEVGLVLLKKQQQSPPPPPEKLGSVPNKPSTEESIAKSLTQLTINNLQRHNESYQTSEGPSRGGLGEDDTEEDPLGGEGLMSPAPVQFTGGKQPTEKIAVRTDFRQTSGFQPQSQVDLRSRPSTAASKKRFSSARIGGGGGVVGIVGVDDRPTSRPGSRFNSLCTPDQPTDPSQPGNPAGAPPPPNESPVFSSDHFMENHDNFISLDIKPKKGEPLFETDGFEVVHPPPQDELGLPNRNQPPPRTAEGDFKTLSDYFSTRKGSASTDRGASLKNRQKEARMSAGAAPRRPSPSKQQQKRSQQPESPPLSSSPPSSTSGVGKPKKSSAAPAPPAPPITSDRAAEKSGIGRKMSGKQRSTAAAVVPPGDLESSEMAIQKSVGGGKARMSSGRRKDSSAQQALGQPPLPPGSARGGMSGVGVGVGVSGGVEIWEAEMDHQDEELQREFYERMAEKIADLVREEETSRELSTRRVKHRNESVQQKIDQLRHQKFEEDQRQLTESVRSTRRAHEDRLMRNLYTQVVQIQKQQLADEQAAHRQSLRDAQREEKTRKEALSNYYATQVEMIQENMMRERSDRKLAEKAQKQALDSLVKETKKAQYQKLQQMRDKMRSEEEARYYRTFDEKKLVENVLEKLKN